MNETRNIGDTLLKVDNISLSFGGVKAITGVSLEIREREICAIIGPNGAGKTSMLNVINGFYHPQEGTITFGGEVRKQMRPHLAAAGGIARTFQNVALFTGMSTLDKWITAHLDTDLVSKEDLSLAQESDWLRRKNRLLKEEREIIKKATQFFAGLKQ